MAGKWWVVEVPSGLPRDPGLMVKSVRQEPLPVDAVKVSGPYNTQAEAEASLKKATGGNPSLPSQVHKAKGYNLPNPLSGIEQVGAVIEAFYRAITDGKFWRSIGWILLGIVLLIGGIVLWMKKNNLLPDVVPLPV